MIKECINCGTIVKHVEDLHRVQSHRNGNSQLENWCIGCVTQMNVEKGTLFSEELMIGSWVRYQISDWETSKPLKVLGIMPTYVDNYINNLGLFIFDVRLSNDRIVRNDKITLIPMTERMMEMLGFKGTDSEAPYYQYSPTASLKADMAAPIKYLYCGDIKFDCEYVHQFQRIIKCLTGEDIDLFNEIN